jgi:hypothetical protein
MERHSCLNHAEITERAGLEFICIFCASVSFFIFFITDCKEGMIATVLDCKFRAVSVTGCEVSFKMRTVTLQKAAHEESELMLRLQLQALCLLGLKFETFKHKQVSKKTHYCVKGVNDI